MRTHCICIANRVVKSTRFSHLCVLYIHVTRRAIYWMIDRSIDWLIGGLSAWKARKERNLTTLVTTDRSRLASFRRAARMTNLRFRRSFGVQGDFDVPTSVAMVTCKAAHCLAHCRCPRFQRSGPHEWFANLHGQMNANTHLGRSGSQRNARIYDVVLLLRCRRSPLYFMVNVCNMQLFYRY